MSSGSRRAQQRLDGLLPRPRSVKAGDELVEDRDEQVFIDASPDSRSKGRSQGYVLEVASDRIVITATDEAGAFYGGCTLAQLRRLNPHGLPSCRIEDWPDFPVRGVMIDISRDKVPALSTLESLVDLLASWKINQLQLYMEHTFAYEGHEEVWAAASALTPEEVLHLDAFCRARFVELVPNQNTLGHMERWLWHPRYHDLAIAPAGRVDGFGLSHPASTLDPSNPGSLALVRDLLGQLGSCFESRRFHVGLDEPWELPAEAANEYLSWMRDLRALDELDTKTMLVWGDRISSDPSMISQLPEGVVVCEWGYEDWHPFAEKLAALSAEGREAWVCSGTSSWLSILGRTGNMVRNCSKAAKEGLGGGATGYLITDWGDMGHLQYLPISYPGFAYGAGVSWCWEQNRSIDLATALSLHVFDDPSMEMGGAAVALGDTYDLLSCQFPNLSTLVLHLYFPQLALGVGFTAGLSVQDLNRVEEYLVHAVASLDSAQPRSEDAVLAVDELRSATALVSLLARDGIARLEGDGTLSSLPAPQRGNFARELAPLIEHHRELWLARNRGGGLARSVAWLEHLRECYETGETDPGWAGPDISLGFGPGEL